jgi:hypothetical protein
VTDPLDNAIKYSVNGIDYQTSNVFNNLAPGTYQVTVRNNSTGCVSAATTAVLSAPGALAAPTVTVVNNCGSSMLTASSFTGTLTWSNGANTASITVTTPGIYTVTQTIGNCTSPAGSGTAAPQAAPAITTQPAPQTVCAGATATFSVTATGTNLRYQWQVSTDKGSKWSNVGTNSSILRITNVTATANGYLYRVIVSGACSPAVTSSRAGLTVNTAPANPGAISGSTCLSAGSNNNSYAVSGVSGVVYNWTVPTGWSISGQGTSSIRINVPTSAKAGNYEIKVVATNSCGSSSSSSLKVSIGKCATTTLVSTTLERTMTEEAPEIGLQVYPNPAITQFTVKVTSTDRQQPITVIIYDQLGKVLDVKRELRSGQVIQVGANYTQGAYFIEMIQGSNRKRLQVVKSN